jgi:dUTP pyrophosphatase
MQNEHHEDHEEKFFQKFMYTINNKTHHDKIMHLSIFVESESDNALKNKYVIAAVDHNNKIIQDPHFYDAGFDMLLPKFENGVEGEGVTPFFSSSFCMGICKNKIDFKIRCCAKICAVDDTCGKGHNYYTGFYVHPRSSLSKTPLRLANSTGIIDAGYRGHLIGMLDCLFNNPSCDKKFDYYAEPYTRLLQICAPNLIPIYVKIVNSVEELGPSTSRGDGAFGSTGK